MAIQCLKRKVRTWHVPCNLSDKESTLYFRQVYKALLRRKRRVAKRNAKIVERLRKTYIYPAEVENYDEEVRCGMA